MKKCQKSPFSCNVYDVSFHIISYHFMSCHVISYHFISFQISSTKKQRELEAALPRNCYRHHWHLHGPRAWKDKQSHEHGYDIIIRSCMSLRCYSAFMTCYDSDPKHPHQPRLATKVLKSQVSEVLTGFPTVMLGEKKKYVYDMV